MYHYAVILYHLTTARRWRSGDTQRFGECKGEQSSFRVSPGRDLWRSPRARCGSQRLETPLVARRSGRGGAVVVASPPVARWWPVGGPDRPNDFSLNFKKCSGRQLLGGTVVLKARPSCSGPLRYAREPRRGRARPGVACGAGGFRQVLWCAQYQGACTRASPVRVRAVLRPWWPCMSVRPSAPPCRCARRVPTRGRARP